MGERACADGVGARERLEMGGGKDGGMSERGCADMSQESQKERKPKKPESQKARKPERQKAKKPESQ